MTPQEIWNQINNLVEDKETNECVWYIISELRESNKENEAIKYIEKFFKCDSQTANEVFEIFKKQTGNPPSPQQIAHANAVAREWQNQPKCPICSSTNIQKISITKRAVKTAFFGALGAVDDAGKTYQCKNCGSKF